MNNLSRSIVPGNRKAAFSMVEMIGVLAIIAILAVIIVPKVFSTIASARITSAASSAAAMKTAIVDYASRYGSIPVTNLTPNARLDDLLVVEGLLDARFAVKIGTPQTAAAGATYTRSTGVWAGGASQALQTKLICLVSTVAVPSASLGANYYLNGGNVSLPAGAHVVSAVIMQVTGTEARELSLRIDGDANTQLTATTADNAGKVVYALPVAGMTDVYIYIAHQ
jgi:type II secretory pathway pseudopilin PulG